VLRLRFADFARATRSSTLPQATARTQTVLDAARELLAASAPLIRTRGLTLVGISLTSLERDDRVQLALPFEPAQDASLDAALDAIHERFGPGAVTRALLLGRDPGISMPLPPD
jgi:DNA polymerase-4